MHTGMPNNAHIPKLLNIARMSHKYAFKSLESWACDTIQQSISSKHRLGPILVPIITTSLSFEAENKSEKEHKDDNDSNSEGASNSDLPTATQDILPSIIRVAQLCGHEKLLATALSVVRGLMTSSNAYLILALNLADNLSIPSLKGSAYFEILLRGPTFWTPEHISKAQKGRLLQGYYQLTTEWDKIRANPLCFEHAQSCGATWHQQGCATSWHEFWKKQVVSDGMLKVQPADVGGRLRYLGRELDKWGQVSNM